MKINLKRAYEPASAADGQRILVERLWPRGISKEKAAIDIWMKDIAPSPELRKWYSHDLAKWDEFRRRYQDELIQNRKEVEALRELIRKSPVTFVYAARDEEHNSALVLKDFLEKR